LDVFFIDVDKMWACLYIFVYILMTASSPGSRRYESFFWLEFLLASRQSYKSLEGLLDFPAFLVPALWPNSRKIENSWNSWNFFGITFKLETL